MFKVHDADSSLVNGHSDCVDPLAPANANFCEETSRKNVKNLYSMNDLIKKSP